MVFVQKARVRPMSTLTMKNTVNSVEALVMVVVQRVPTRHIDMVMVETNVYGVVLPVPALVPKVQIKFTKDKV